MDHDQLILKYLNQTITDAERQVLESWINESEQNKKELEDFTLMWQLTRHKATPIDFRTDDDWSKFERTITVNESELKVRMLPRFSLLKMAAVLILIALCSSVVYLFFYKQDFTTKVSGNAIAQVTLPDGSLVWLNKQSRISYANDFNTEDRVVNLEGEAFFDVKKDTERAFIVQMDRAQVTVVGTSFNVSAYKANNRVEVFVATGLVSFSRISKANGIKLKPGETGVFDKKGNAITLLEGENMNALAWKEQKLVFKKTSVENVLKTLESYFKINVQVKNRDIFKCRFTGLFDKPELAEIIEALSVSLGLTITQEGNFYVIAGDGC